MPTTNPVPSQDPSDLLFNAGKLDEVVSGSNATYTDRLGISRRTMAGIDAAADLVLGGLGYAPPVAYAAGIALTLTTQTVEYAGEVYAPKVANLPFTTSGTFETAKFRLIQGVASADLASGGGSAMVGYTPAGTGAVATNVQSKLRETVSVKDFWAVGDGVTDDTTSIQDALDHVLITGQELEFEQGTYNHTGLIYEGSNLKMVGKNATLNYTGLNNIDAFIVRSPLNLNASRCYISGIEFLNGYASLKIFGQGNGIYSDINITECKFKDSESGMLWMEHCSDVVIDANYFENGGDNGIYYAFSRNAVISNNVLRNCGGSGSITFGYVDGVITKAEGIMVIGNTIYADASAPVPTITWTYGIDGAYCERCSIVGNIMYNTADAVPGRLMKAGIALEEHIIRDVLVFGNKITNVPEEGIRLGVVGGAGWHLSNITIADNQIFGCRTAIDVDLTINSLISNNKITRCRNHGVNVKSGCSGITVSGNTIQDANQQNAFGSFLGVYAQAPSTNVVGNHFVDSQTGGVIDSIVGAPDATYSVDANGLITFFSIGVPYATVATAGKTWGQIKADIEANAGWSLTLFAGCDLYAPAVVRRTGYRWDGNVQQYNVPSVMTTGEPYYYVGLESSAPNSQVFGNTYKTNVGTLPNNHGNAEYFLNNATNGRMDASIYGARQYYATTTPVSGYWIRGDIVWNTTPSAGGPPGWTCVATGTPGTWKAMANLAP